jgi:anti-anti-sigma factor
LFAYNAAAGLADEGGGTVLTVTVDQTGDVIVLHCRGRLVRGEESALLCAAVHHHDRDLVLDLSAVEAIDAAGVGALVSLQAAGVYMRLVKPSERVRAILRLTGLASLFEVVEADLIPAADPVRTALA